MFTTIIVQPIFNLLVLIYALLPGHNFGLAVIIFTVVVRLLLWPLVKKQLHHTKAIRALQPELKKIKKAAGGDRRRESQMVMELYKERQINPFSSIGILLVQAPILIGLYVGLQKLIKEPEAIVNFSYSWLHGLPWLQTLSENIHRFDSSLFGLVDLKRVASEPGGFYWPAMVLVLMSAVMQYYQSKQLMPAPKESRSLRKILSEAGQGKKADQEEVAASVGRSTLFLIPFIIVIVGIHIAAALALYMFVSSFVAYIQQSIILKEDVEEAEAVADSTKPEVPVSRGVTRGSKNKRSAKKQAKRRRR